MPSKKLSTSKSNSDSLEFVNTRTYPKESEKRLQKEQAKSEKRPTRRGICFVLMPYGGWFDDYYDTIFKRAIEDVGLEARRADELYRPGTIVNDIWTFTQSARIVIADLTGRNPNVFYELGMAHTLAKPAILITESIENVPFDLRALRVLEYDKNKPNWGEDLRGRVSKAIAEILESPLESVLPAFLKVKRDVKPRTVTQQEKAILELRHELDLLRRDLSSYRPRENELITPEIAEYLLRDYVKMGLSKSEILGRLVAQGVPNDWIARQLGLHPQSVSVALRSRQARLTKKKKK